MSPNSEQIENSLNGITKIPSPEIGSQITTKPNYQVNRNGFGNYPTLYQIMPVLYALLMLVQMTILAESLEVQAFKISLFVVYYIIFFMVTKLWYTTTKIDPTDSIQSQHRKAIQNKVMLDTRTYKFFCYVCMTCVSKNSFHCRRCNRCVDGFDHHCRWLNNCVGAKNYLQFFALIASTEILLIFHTVINILHIIDVKNRNSPLPWNFYLEALVAGWNIVVTVANSALLIKHISLVIRNKTTLDTILQTRNANKIHPVVDHRRSMEERLDNRNIKADPSESSLQKSQLSLEPFCVKSSVNVNKKNKIKVKSKSLNFN